MKAKNIYSQIANSVVSEPKSGSNQTENTSSQLEVSDTSKLLGLRRRKIYTLKHSNSAPPEPKSWGKLKGK